MATDTYSKLKTAISAFSARSDIDSVFDYLLELAEDRINSALRLKGNSVRSRGTATVDSRFFALPTDFLEMRAITLIKGTNAWQLRYVPISAMDESSQSVSGRPDKFSISSQLEFERPFDFAYTLEMHYYTNLSALTSSNTTNDVLTKYPSIYIYGVMLELAIYEEDDGQIGKYNNLFDSAIMRANTQDVRGRIGPVPKMVFDGPTP